MSRAREIIEERLARGEISSDEFDALTAKLDAGLSGASAAPSDTPPVNCSTAVTASPNDNGSSENKLPYILLIAPIVVVFGYRFLSGDSDTNLLAPFRPYDGFISFAMIASAFYGIYKLVR
ncbi:hypothetical protein HW571_27695 [Agrobacterium genomosp. 3]|nr:hypothetical protein [Agrobacterium tomkonis]MCA1894979.1 hypothetical protein [Agrobacterium tomkonis]